MTYGLATTVAFMAIGSPGGDDEGGIVRDYVASGHWVAAWALAYVGAFGALGLLVFGSRLRTTLAAAGDLLWGLAVAATATSVVGWFVDGGVVVSLAEGGGPCRPVWRRRWSTRSPRQATSWRSAHPRSSSE